MLLEDGDFIFAGAMLVGYLGVLEEMKVAWEQCGRVDV
jgi:hypothetical protein